MIYLVLGDEATGDELEKLIKKAFPEDASCQRIGAQQWLVRADASTGKAVWNQIVGDEHLDPPISVVIPFNNYYGVHYTYVWDWTAPRAD